MSRVFISRQTGAAVFVFAADHCPPHVHARHRGEGWVARVEFSYLSSDLGLISVTPLKATPPRAVIRRLMDDIGDQIPALSAVWWDVRGSTCLENRWLVPREDGGVEVSTRMSPDAARIDAADYDPDRRCLILWPVGLPPVEIDVSPEEVAR